MQSKVNQNVSKVWQAWGDEKRNCFLGKYLCLLSAFTVPGLPQLHPISLMATAFSLPASELTGTTHRSPVGPQGSHGVLNQLGVRSLSTGLIFDQWELLDCQWTLESMFLNFFFLILFPIATNLQIFTLSVSSKNFLYLNFSLRLCLLILCYR